MPCKQDLTTLRLQQIDRVERGFTLLEVLVAIAITALIGLGIWNLLGGAIRANESSQKHSAQLIALQNTMRVLYNDFSQLSSRPVRNSYGDMVPALTTRNALNLVELTSGGRRNPLEKPLSDLQRIYYEVNESQLYRVLESGLDAAYDSEPRKQKLLDDVEDIKISFLTDQNRWLNSWPPEQVSEEENELSVLPFAVRIEIEQSRYGKISRLIDLPSPPTIKDKEDTSNNEQSENGGS